MSANTNRVSKILAGVTLGGGAGLGLLNALSSGFSRWTMAAPFCLLIGGAVALMLSESKALNAILAAWSLTISLLVASYALIVLDNIRTRKTHQAQDDYAAARGKTYDHRRQGQFLRDERARNVFINPSFDRATFFTPPEDGFKPLVIGDDGTPLLPLGDISNALTVRGNETGTYLVYPSDERGFNNLAGTWSRPHYRVVFVGDSYVQGMAVPPEQNLTAPMRAVSPDVAALGRAGNGPLSDLALVLEYLPQRRPEIVVWVYTEFNDVYQDLEEEKATGILPGYLQKPPRLQHLDSRQPEIDRKLKQLLEVKTAENNRRTILPDRLNRVLTLADVEVISKALTTRQGRDFDMLGRILETARDAISSWNGRMVFVYLALPHPSEGSSESIPKPVGDKHLVLDICKRLNLPVIDLPAKAAQDPKRVERACYPYPGHLSPDGYMVFGQMIVEALRGMGWLESAAIR